jgi:hypothetical protein
MSTHETKHDAVKDQSTDQAFAAASANELLELIAQGHDANDLASLIGESLDRRAAA